MSHDLVAWVRACDGLGVDRGTCLAADEASVWLKYRIAEAISAPGTVAKEGMRQRGRAEVRQWAAETTSCAALTEAGLSAARQAVTADDDYVDRVVDLALADVLSEPMAPEVCIEPEPRPLEDAGVGCTHALVFHDGPLITHELYPLVADAMTYDASQQTATSRRVIAVHGDWLEDGRARRVIVYDVEYDRFREMTLVEPLSIESAQFVALGERQTERHRCWADRVDCAVVNPAASAAMADDKARTLNHWRQAGLPVPEGELLTEGQRQRAHDLLDLWGDIIIKPNAGTEGERVLPLRAATRQATDRLDAHLASCWEWGPVLLERRCDGIAWRDPESGYVRSLVLRLHVAFDGDQFVAESGYALVGVDDDSPAARRCGGQTQPLVDVLEHLVRRSDGQPVPQPVRLIGELARLAEEAASRLPRIGLCGVDLVLDTGVAGLAPVLLELNPRPAGLAHSRFLPEGDENRRGAGVSIAVWSGIARTSAESVQI